uniref:ATP synthase F0 subunit 8 n=1 Tax=Acropyga silvestrii TaxID=602227 RepID=A0A6G5NJ56_9HYME|nr:ATP synthase F0 subunit 8 [Acropyga silvestrii]
MPHMMPMMWLMIMLMTLCSQFLTLSILYFLPMSFKSQLSSSTPPSTFKWLWKW